MAHLRLRSGRLLTGVALVVALLVLASGAHADNISIGLQQAGINGGAITTVASGSGFASFVGGYGSFTFNSVSGTGSPILAEPSLASTSLDVQNSIGSDIIHVFVTQSGLTSPTGVNSFLSSFTSQTFTGAITLVVEQTFIDTGNGLYGGTLLASSNFTGLGSNSSVNSTPSLSNPYSETVEYTITATGAGRVNDTINIDAALPVPEPSSLLLSALGVGGLLLRKRRIWSA